MKQPITIDKRKLAAWLLCGACLLAPAPFAWQAVQPMLAAPTQQLFNRLPVAYRDLSPIRIRHRAIKNIRVRVIPQRANIKVTYKDLSPIPIIRRGYGEGGPPTGTGMGGIDVRHTRSRGIQHTRSNGFQPRPMAPRP